MVLNFNNPGFNYSIDSIMLFQDDEISDYWRDSLFAVYPQLDRKMFDMFDSELKRVYLRDKLYDVYMSEEVTLSKKVTQYNDHWEQHRKEIEDALSEAFGIDCHNGFDDINGNITLNPICPRFLDTRTFDVFYKYSEKGAMGTAIHEVIHFIWFDIWQQHFQDNTDEYETPNIKWVFSEAVVDTITRNDKRLYEKYPFAEYAYAYFYDIKVDGVPLLEMLNDIYKGANIIEFIEKGYELFLIHESEIRKYMKQRA